jgi:hypothetical protein
MLDEFLDAIALTQYVGVTLDQPGKEYHAIRVYGSCLLTLRKIGIRTRIDNDPILDPNGLAFDKFSGQSVEECPIDKNGIRRRVARNDLIKLHHLVSKTPLG